MKTLFAVCLAVVSLAGCHVPVPEVVVSGNTTEIRKKAGETFVVALKANATTGYSWALDGKEDASIVSNTGQDYVSDAHAPGIVGSGGTEKWKFSALKPGTTVLHFVYRRAWEKDVKPAEEHSVTVRVE